MKWPKSGDIPGKLQKPPVQEGLWWESGVGFPSLAAGAKECFSRRQACSVPSGIIIKCWSGFVVLVITCQGT